MALAGMVKENYDLIQKIRRFISWKILFEETH